MTHEERNKFVELRQSERSQALDARAKIESQLDAHVVTLSAGTIALSITFAEKLAPKMICPGLLYSSWFLLIASIVTYGLAAHFSWRLWQYQIDLIDVDIKNPEGGNVVEEKRVGLRKKRDSLSGNAYRLCIASRVAFALALLVMVFFAIANIHYGRAT